MDFVTHGESCIEIYGFNGSDVTNVIFNSLYSSVIPPSRCVLELDRFYMSWHEIKRPDLSEKCLNVLQLFHPSWWESALWFQ